MGLIDRLRGAARDARRRWTPAARTIAPPPAPAPAPRPVDAMCDCVADADVLEHYSVIAARPFDMVDWGKRDVRYDRTLALFEVADALVTTGYVCADPAGGRVFANSSYNIAADRLLAARAEDGRYRLRSDAPNAIAGTALVMGGPYERNYYHALMNWALRFAMVDALAPHLLADPSIRVMVDVRAQEEPFRSLYALLDLPLDRVIWTDETQDYRIERAIVPSFVNEGEVCAELMHRLVAKIRDKLGIAPAAHGTRRFWISREHHPEARRRVVDFDQIAPVLARHDVETIVLDDLGFADQVRLFTDAALVTGSHGAGFVNAMFCPPSAKLLPVENDFTRYFGISNLFVELAAGVGVASEIVPAATVRLPDRDYQTFVDHHQADVRLDPAVLDEMLSRHPREAAA